MKILVLEESPLTRKFIINELKTEGFEIEVAATAEEALGILETVPDIKLVTLRVVMEGMDGFEFVNHLHSKEIRERLRPLNNHQVPTIFVTSNDTDEDRLRGYKVGAADFIQKPWPKGDLVKHVNMALGRGTEFSGLTVLVVDDSPTARHFISSCLAHLGVTILEADDGETAVEILADPATHVDLVVTDLNMVRMNGDELCVKIRGELGLTKLPIIFLSGNEDKTTILSLFKMGATDYLKKPFMKEELVARLRAYLDQETSRQALETSVSRLQESNLLKDEFMTVCSQDLYSPMESILAHVEELQGKGQTEGDPQDKAEAIRNSGKHLLSILSSLMDIGRIASDREKLRMVRLDWTDILDSALSGQRPLAAAKGIRLNRSVSSSGTCVRGDRPSLLRVCNNVLSNAVKFTPPGGAIQVKLGNGRLGEVVLEVSDSGVGIASDRLPEIFDRYHRSTTVGTTGEKGTGLGLAITRELVERHGGTMAVESAPGDGTTVKVILPQPSASQAKDPDEQHSSGEGSSQQIGATSRVLLVDDEPGHLTQGKILLEGLGCQVTIASSGMDAVKLFKRTADGIPFDLVLLDLDLPIQSGLQTALALRESESAEPRDQVPILAMTSHSLDGQLGQLLAAGVNDFLAKPLASQPVSEALERWLPVLA
jgi:CheY-like chemotaxis protein